MRPSILLVLAGLSASGCGSSGAAGDGGPGGAPAGDSMPAVGSDAGGSGADTRLDPLSVGRSWTYAVDTRGEYGACPSGSQVATVLGTQVVGGRTALEATSFCPGYGSSFYTVDGDAVDVYYATGSTWLHALDVPVADGHTWTSLNTSFTWHEVGAHTIPAGTYPDCWKATQNVSYTAYTIYCRGVGMVESYLSDLNGDGWDAVLTAKSF